jgi:hypothetical protein
VDAFHPLAGTRLKVKRAKKDLDVLHRKLQAFIASNPYRFDLEINLEKRTNIYRPYLIRQIPSDWSALVGSFAYSLRSALDNLAWALAITRDERTIFPIFLEESTEFTNRLGRLREDVREETKAVQPYNRASGQHSHPLWVLHRLNIVDKHRAIAVGRTKLVIPTGLESPKFAVFDGAIRFDKGGVEFELPMTANQPEDFQPELRAEISFDISEPPWFPPHPYRVTHAGLAEIYNFVADDVLPRFTRFFP